MSAPTGYGSPKSNISGYNVRQLPNFSPEQMKLFQSLLGKVGVGGAGGGGLGQGLDYLGQLAGGQGAGFEQEEAPAYAAYQKALGGAANRFAGLGALNSSGFQNLASSGAQELGMNLAARRGDIQRNAIEKLLGLSESLLSKQPYSYGYEEKKPSFLGGLLGGLGNTAIGALLGGPGTAAGAGLSAIANLFGGQKQSVQGPGTFYTDTSRRFQ